MPSFNPRVFTNPDRLKHIDGNLLIRLLSPWSFYFSGRGINIPQDLSEEFPYQRLSSALMTYDDAMPQELMDALYYIDETACIENFDDLIERAEEEGVAFFSHGKSTAADIAVQIWLANPKLLEERHNRVLAFKKQAFVHFPGKRSDFCGSPTITDAQLRNMAALMDPFFLKRQRGRGSRVFCFPKPEEGKIWLLVRHGMPTVREGKHEDNGEPGVEFYRPQKHDVLIYDLATRALAVNAQSKGEKKLYCEVVGEVVFDNPSHFNEGSIFTLEPLRRLGPDLEICDDIDGIDSVKLLEVVKVIPGEVSTIDIKKSSDLFRSMGPGWTNFIKFGRITSVKFGFKFEGGSKTRCVTLRPDSTRYDQDSDASIIEDWMRAKGFYSVPPTPSASDDAVLASA